MDKYMNNEEKNVLNRMEQIHLLTDGIKEIEEFEMLVSKIRKYNDILTIPRLCMIMDDDVCDSSTMEQVIETILLIIKSKEENIDKGINLVLENTSEMMKRAEDWAIILHTQFLFDKKLKDRYIECVKRNKHKKTIIEIMKILRDENTIKKINFTDVIDRMK